MILSTTTLSIMILRITTFSIMIFTITTFSIMIFRITAHNKICSFAALSINDTQHCSNLCTYAENCYAG